MKKTIEGIGKATSETFDKAVIAPMSEMPADLLLKSNRIDTIKGTASNAMKSLLALPVNISKEVLLGMGRGIWSTGKFLALNAPVLPSILLGNERKQVTTATRGALNTLREGLQISY